VPSTLHRCRGLLVFAACIGALSCRSYMPYAGRPLDSTSTALKIISDMLDQQPAAIQVEVTDEKFRILLNHLLGPSAVTIYYTRIGDILLSKKRGVFAVTISSPAHVALVHLHTYDQAYAEHFIDALETMRRGANARASDTQ
jgi:hypothetical protein